MSLRRARQWLGLVGTLALASCAGASGGIASAENSDAASHALLGGPAPSIDLRGASGAASSLEAHAGKVVLVDFWATWCKPCRLSFPAYQRLLTKLGGDLVVIGVSQDDDQGEVAAFLADTGAKFPIVWDEGKLIAKAYDPPTMPTAFVLDRNGIVRFVHRGYRAGDEAILEEEVRSLLR